MGGETLQSLALSLSEARAENERLRAALAQSDLPCAYCSLPKDEWAKCASGFPGCDRADDAMGCPELGARLSIESATRQRDEALEALKASEEREAGLREALKPFGALAGAYFYRYETRPGEFRESHENDPDERAVYGINRVEITTGDFRRARSALENGPAPLADATNDPSDLSSLRKGAEVGQVVIDRDLVERAQHQLSASPFPFDRCVAAEISAALVSGSREGQP